MTALVATLFNHPLQLGRGARAFLAGEENAVVEVAWQAALEHRMLAMPLVFFGPTGVGKTLLADNLAEAWQAAEPSRQFLRLTGTDFARHYADAVDTDSISDFRRSTRHAGLILIDAVHDLVDRPAATREFCYQLDRWLRDEKLVVCTSLEAPSAIVNESLASRLSGGLVLKLSPPGGETRRHLVAHFADQRSLRIADEVLDQIADSCESNGSPSPRELQALVLQLHSKARLTGSSLDADFVTGSLDHPTNAVDTNQILAAVAKRFGVTAAELRSSSRQKSLVHARGVVALLVRSMTGQSLQSVGKLLGNRDHSTVHNSLRKIETLLETDLVLQTLVDDIRAAVQRKATRVSSKESRTPAKVKRGGAAGA